MSNHPFLAFLPPNRQQLVRFISPTANSPSSSSPPSHLDGVSSCLTMLRMLHQAPQSACHISPGHPAREGGRHLCGHKSPCFGGREGERFPVCPTRRHADGRGRPPSERASKQKGSRWWEQLAAFSKRSAPFNAYSDVPFKARCYKSKASHCWAYVCSQLVVRNKLESISEYCCVVADKGEANWRQRFSNHLLSRGIDAFASRARARALRDNCNNTVFKFPPMPKNMTCTPLARSAQRASPHKKSCGNCEDYTVVVVGGGVVVCLSRTKEPDRSRDAKVPPHYTVNSSE